MPPWWGWIAGALLGLGAGLIFYMGGNVWYRLLPLAVFPVVVLIGMWWLGRLAVSVSDEASGEGAEDWDGAWFHVDDAKLPAWAIGEVEVLRGHALSDMLSVGAHPLGFVVQRPWCRAAVLVRLADEDDPTPYWIVSSRRPEELAEALAAVRDAAGPRPEPGRSARTGREPRLEKA